MPDSAQQIARAIRGLLAEQGLSQTTVGKRIGRTQGYVSERVSGIDAWNTMELEQLAQMLGFRDAFDLLSMIEKRK